MPDPVMNPSYIPTQRVQSMFEDPVNKELMVDPWLYSDGYTYDRRTGDKLDESPMTRRPVYPLGPNVALRSDLFEAFPQQADRYRKRHRIKDAAAAAAAPALTDKQRDQLESIQLVLEASMVERDARREQIARGLEAIDTSVLMARIKTLLMEEQGSAFHRLGYGLSVSKRGLGRTGASHGVQDYMRHANLSILPSAHAFLDEVIGKLGSVAQELSQGREPGDVYSSSDSEYEYEAQEQQAQEQQAQSDWLGRESSASVNSLQEQARARRMSASSSSVD